MKRIIKKLESNNLDDVIKILDMTYPPHGDKKPNRDQYLKDALKLRDSGEFYGCFEEETLVGTMQLYNFKMNLLTFEINAGGIGYLAVDSLHKRQGIAKEMLRFYLNECRSRNMAMAILYPFNIDYYKELGFVCAAKMHQYSVHPLEFPRTVKPEHIVMLGGKDKSALLKCFLRYFRNSNGMVMKREQDIESLFKSNLVAAYIRGGDVEGYAAFHFKKVSPEFSYLDYMIVEELIWNTPEALRELCAFFNTQSDQVSRIILNTPIENFHLILHDPSNGRNEAFLNIRHEIYQTANDSMCRIIEARRIFELLSGHRFGDGNIVLKINVLDSFQPEYSETVVVRFSSGSSMICEDREDAEISLNISNFTALITGSVCFEELYEMGQAEITNPDYVSTISGIFYYRQKPKTITYF